MNLNENVQKWSNIISEELHVEKQSTLSWMSQYAANHEMFEAVQAHGAGVNVDGGIYSTPLNTMGIGNPAMPQAGLSLAGTGKFANSLIGTNAVNFHDQKVGSGDIPMSTLTMSLEIAAMTIGLELVPVIPANGPWAMLSYMDFPYAGGKMGRINETSLDGKGDGDINKPIYIRVPFKLVYAEGKSKKDLIDYDDVTFTSDNGVLAAKFIGFSRIDNSIIVRVVSCKKSDKNVSIADVFEAAVTVAFTKSASALGAQVAQTVTADLVNGAADHVQGFANFAGLDGEGNGMNPDPMTRAQNETGVGNTIGARMFTRLVQMGAYEVTGSVTRQQLQDMPLYGIDVIGKVLEAMQNEISQHINNRVLDRVFKLGVENAKVQRDYQGVDLNLYFGATNSAEKALAAFGSARYMKDLADSTAWQAGWMVKNATLNTAAENTHTHQRRIASRALAAANLIANVSRFGRGQWLVTNTQVLSALQDCSGFVYAPMTNTLTQDGSNSLYFAGSLMGLQVYVDPYMLWDDTRICVGRKSDGNTPGVIFMPYILADTVQTVVEGTMAPKLLVNSRFAIVDAGFHPEQNYFTFAVEAEGAYFL